jgi:CheY-like chemotaxis protein
MEAEIRPLANGQKLGGLAYPHRAGRTPPSACCWRSSWVDEGFDITEAESGDQAILLLGQHGSFDLVFTDISLPGRADGNEVATTAKQRYPDMPVLYSSSSPDSLTNKIEPGDAFMTKPCRLNDISNVVQQLLSVSMMSRQRLRA